MQKNLPIKDIVIQSWDLIKENYVKLIMASMLYIIFTIGMSFYNFLTLKPDNPNFGMVHYLLALVWFVVFIYTSVRFHRIFLLPSEETSTSLWFNWHERETKFLLRWFVIMLWMTVIMIPLILLWTFTFGLEEGGESLIYIVVSMAVMYYFISRFSLVLPAAAIDAEYTSTRWSWRQSKGNALRLFILLSFAPLVMTIITSVLPVESNIFARLISDVLNIVIIPFTICFLSLAYKFFTDNSCKEQIEVAR